MEILGERDEGISVGQENLPQLQSYSAQGRGAGDLYGSSPQAAPRLIEIVLEDEHGTYRRYQYPTESAF